jgi:hypothetical protein
VIIFFVVLISRSLRRPTVAGAEHE